MPSVRTYIYHRIAEDEMGVARTVQKVTQPYRARAADKTDCVVLAVDAYYSDTMFIESSTVWIDQWLLSGAPQCLAGVRLRPDSTYCYTIAADGH